MADLYDADGDHDGDEPEAYPGDTSGHLHPALIDFRQQFANGAGAQWAKAVADKIQTYVTTRAIADQASAAGNAFMVNAHQAQQNLVGMVEQDPHSADLALSLAGDAAGALASHHPDGDEKDAAVASLAQQFRGQIAHAAVQSLSAVDPGAARDALSRYSEHLGEDQQAGLGQYISNMQRVRLADQRAEGINTARLAVEHSNTLTNHYLSGLVNDSTGMVQYPPGWGKGMMLDPRLAPDAKASLYTAYNQLQANGDAAQSDPAVLTSLLERATAPPHTPEHPMPPDIVRHVGQDLTANDALWLAGRVGPQDAQTQNETQSLVDALGQAREYVGTGRGSENAYGRFVNWFLPTYQKYTAGGIPGADLLDPNSSAYLLSDERMNGFRPGGADIIKDVIGVKAEASPETRKSLGEIFGGSPRTPAGDAVLTPESPLKLPAETRSQQTLPGVFEPNPAEVKPALYPEGGANIEKDT